MRPLTCALALVCVTGLFHRSSGQSNPAPATDRVGFPANYAATFTKLLTVDRPDNGQIRVIWANQTAAAVPYWEPYPYGSVILFESWTSKRDAANNLLFDENGRLIPNTLSTLFVKRKEPGFGEDYRQNRNGELEYTAYRPDGTVQTTPQNSAACAVCHLQAGPPADWTFRRRSFSQNGGGLIPAATISQYAFIPRDLTVKKGALVTWHNNDEVEHDISIPDLGIHSGILQNGNTFTQRLNVAGDYEIRCSIHSGMRAKVKVVE